MEEKAGTLRRRYPLRPYQSARLAERPLLNLYPPPPETGVATSVSGFKDAYNRILFITKNEYEKRKSGGKMKIPEGSFFSANRR